ncbi:hypothetical protein [Microvirga pudoricolor]|uniref:hypothetical protein n=1 Tax=Microvirga pudoricolor TaxID=2778729 RepID=UPI00195143C4|nr:hypothetical protein [Microvirga pudoricolor]MBM6595863.1 hypothetical protein [Microvirga pudoricolor]
MTFVRTLQQISDAGSTSQPNEDGWGVRGRFAWIVDGATGVSGVKLTSGGSDAAWLAGLITERLQAYAPSEIVLQTVERDLEAAFAGVAGEHPSAEEAVAPSACLGLIEIRDAKGGGLHVRGSFLGDVVALVPERDGVARWTDERAKPFERLTLASLRKGGGGEISDETRAQILENRMSLNRPDGYWVVHPRRPWAGHELPFEAEVEAGRPIVLATDGFMRLVDVFGTYTDETLYDALAAGGASALMAELRGLETEEGSLDSCPRVKAHDDATVLVIAGEAGP